SSAGIASGFGSSGGSGRTLSPRLACRPRPSLSSVKWPQIIVFGVPSAFAASFLKLGIFLSKRTIQKYVRCVRDTHPRGQSWATFLSIHSDAIWSCDSLQTYDLLF